MKSKNNNVKSSHTFFSLSGITSRALLLAVRHIPEHNEGIVIAAAAFGIVELLGAKRFYTILGKAIKTQLRKQYANTNKTRRAPVVTKPKA